MAGLGDRMLIEVYPEMPPTIVDTTCALCGCVLSIRLKTVHGYVCVDCYMKRVVR